MGADPIGGYPRGQARAVRPACSPSRRRAEAKGQKSRLTIWTFRPGTATNNPHEPNPRIGG